MKIIISDGFWHKDHAFDVEEGDRIEIESYENGEELLIKLRRGSGVIEKRWL